MRKREEREREEEHALHLVSCRSGRKACCSEYTATIISLHLNIATEKSNRRRNASILFIIFSFLMVSLLLCTSGQCCHGSGEMRLMSRGDDLSVFSSTHKEER